MGAENKEISVDSEIVGGYKYFNESALRYGVKMLDEFKQEQEYELPERTYTDSILLSAIDKLKNDDIPHHK